MKTLSRRLEKKRKLLLDNYDAEALHALRVTLRRMRSRLKQIPGEQARQLRRELGALADATNSARDWDTLLINARCILSAEQFAQLAPWLEKQQSDAHQRVIHTLQSETWTATAGHWARHEKKHPQAREQQTGCSGQDLSRTVRAVLKAGRKAVEYNDDKRWHRLRIAIKDLRYQLDATPKKVRSATDRDILTLCRQLQVELGEWHDTIVHDKLLLDIAYTMDPASHPQACAALDSLREGILQRGRRDIEQARTGLNQLQALLTVSPATERV